MIVQKHFEVNGRDFILTRSNAGRYVVGGEPFGEYEEACDPAELGRLYAEGELLPDVDDAEALAILLGGDGE